jgi:hypothetical protein
MIEVLPDLADFRFKLVGTYVTEYFLRDSTGKTISEAFADNPAVAKGVRSLMRKCAREKVVIRAEGDAGWIAPGFEEFDAIYLPLSDDGEQVNMILHGFVFDKSEVLMAREIARANGGKLLVVPRA